MADYFADPGAYTSAAFTGSISGTTLTVSAVASGVVCVGATITGPGVTDNTYITAAAGTGGAGTYTVNNNHTTAVPVGTSLNSWCGVPYTTPVWNSAQEGDGKAAGVAVPSVATLVINGVASAGNQLVIAGVTLAAVASGAGNAQFNVGGTVDAQANNIATAINACTTNFASGVATGTPQMRNLLFARGPAGGAPAGTLQIMTRAGSADFNHASVPAMAISSSGWSAAPTITQFVGGVSGVWGYLYNSIAIWPSAVAAGLYGVFRSGANAQPLHGPSTLSVLDDQVNVRTRGQFMRDLGNVTNTSVNRAGLRLVFDDGSGVVSAWSGDTGALTLRALNTGAANGQGWGASAVAFQVVSRALGRVVFDVNSTSSATSTAGPFGVTNTGVSLLQNLRTVIRGTGVLSHQLPTATNNGKLRAVGCEWEVQFNAIALALAVGDANTFVNECVYEEIDLRWTGSPPSPASPLVTLNTTSGNIAEMRRVRAIGLPAPMKMFGGSVTTGHMRIADSCEGFDDASTLVGLLGLSGTASPQGTFMHLYNIGPKRGFVYEALNGYVRWWSGQDYPTLSELLPDATPWSIQVRWSSNTTAAITPARPLRAWRGSRRVESSGNNTVELELLLDPTYAASVTRRHLSLHLAYISDADSKLVTVSTFSDGALTTSTAAWNYGSGTFSTYVKRKLSITLPSDIKAGTDIEAHLTFNLPAPTADQFVFVNPAVAVS